MAESYPHGKRVENTVGKGEIACYKQFLLFPQCFQKACYPGGSKGVWEWVKVSFATLVAFAARADQSKVEQNVQPGLRYTLSSYWWITVLFLC